MSSHRPRHHLTPPQGRLNDPNGVHLSGDTLHVYYQHDPGFPNKPKRTGWGHATTILASPHQLRWTHLPDALYPDVEYDKNGCFSGSAVVDNGQLRLYYTGNVKKHGNRRTTQNLVHVTQPDGVEGGIYRRSELNPLIEGPADGYTAHYRDPHITAHPEVGHWRMLLGAQREDSSGAVVVYHSDDLDNWVFGGEMTFDLSSAVPGSAPDMVPGGYMWECPNLVNLRDEVTGETLDVLVICPQGLDPQNIDGITHYASSDQCGYLVGQLEGTTFHVVRGFSEIDFGHEFYAPQVIQHEGHNNALMIGWMGLPAQDDQPTLHDGWVHCLSVPRILTLRNHTLMQELTLPGTGAEPDELYGRTEMVRMKLAGDSTRVSLISETGAEVMDVAWAPEASGDTGTLTVTRGDDSRVVCCPSGEMVLLVDASAVELTAGNGAVAFASRVFADGDWKVEVTN